jgi:hypothetical protein
MMVWSALLEAVLSPRSVCITDLSALTAKQIVSSINHDGMGRFYNRLAKIFVHKDNVGTITPREELTIGSVGAEVHILSSDYAKAAGYGDIRGAWQVMLREVADLSVTLSDQESLPSALAAGVRSSYDEIILIDDLPSLHVPGSELKLRGYKCK